MPVKQSRPAKSAHFGRIDGSPPGLPGGGMTCMAPPVGARSWISGSAPAGGHNTPSDFASLSLSGSFVCPVVELPRGASVPSFGTARVGAQFVELRSMLDGAVAAGGVAGAGGACATAIAGMAAKRQINGIENDCFMGRKRLGHAGVPAVFWTFRRY